MVKVFITHTGGTGGNGGGCGGNTTQTGGADGTLQGTDPSQGNNWRKQVIMLVEEI